MAWSATWMQRNRNKGRDTPVRRHSYHYQSDPLRMLWRILVNIIGKNIATAEKYRSSSVSRRTWESRAVDFAFLKPRAAALARAGSEVAIIEIDDAGGEVGKKKRVGVAPSPVTATVLPAGPCRCLSVCPLYLIRTHDSTTVERLPQFCCFLSDGPVEVTVVLRTTLAARCMPTSSTVAMLLLPICCSRCATGPAVACYKAPSRYTFKGHRLLSDSRVKLGPLSADW